VKTFIVCLGALSVLTTGCITVHQTVRYEGPEQRPVTEIQRVDVGGKQLWIRTDRPVAPPDGAKSKSRELFDDLAVRR
jgi:hypothetical protein